MASLGHRYDGGGWKADWTAGYSHAKRQTLSMDRGFFGTVNATISNLVLRAGGLDGIYSRIPPRLTVTSRAGPPVDLHDGRQYTGGEVELVFFGVDVGVFGQGDLEAFVEAGVELALQFTDGPVLRDGFDFVETALVGILDAEEEDVMRPTQAERAGRGGFVSQ